MYPLSGLQLSSALAVLVLPLWCSRLVSLRDLRRPCHPCRPTCLGSRVSWYCADWAVDWQVRMIRALLDFDSGSNYRRSQGDTVEYYQRLLMLTDISRGNICVGVAK